MDEVEKAYIAGIIDGEGTVTLMKHHRNETPVPFIGIANNHLKLLIWLKARIGGNICSKKKRFTHHSDSYVLNIRHDRALGVLNEIKQFLIVKQKQAELITKNYKKVTSRSGKYTLEMLKKKYALVSKIRKLNQR